jgi:hypothetical protein
MTNLLIDEPNNNEDIKYKFSSEHSIQESQNFSLFAEAASYSLKSLLGAGAGKDGLLVLAFLPNDTEVVLLVDHDLPALHHLLQDALEVGVVGGLLLGLPELLFRLIEQRLHAKVTLILVSFESLSLKNFDLGAPSLGRRFHEVSRDACCRGDVRAGFESSGNPRVELDELVFLDGLNLVPLFNSVLYPGTERLAHYAEDNIDDKLTWKSNDLKQMYS